mgnify:CR=1 FL=1
MRACARCWRATSDCRSRGLTEAGACVGCGGRGFSAPGSLDLRGFATRQSLDPPFRRRRVMSSKMDYPTESRKDLLGRT